MCSPYVDSLLKGEANDTYDVETYSKHHSQTDDKLRELSKHYHQVSSF